MTDLIKRASEFAKIFHRDQKDDCGEPYWYHLKQVANIVSKVTKDEDVIAAAWLHDTLEDTDVTHDDLTAIFGPKIANLVYMVTHEGEKDSYGRYFPRLLPTEACRDAILIKFADRLSNLSRMEPWSPKRREAYLKKSVFWKIDPPGDKYCANCLVKLVSGQKDCSYCGKPISDYYTDKDFDKNGYLIIN